MPKLTVAVSNQVLKIMQDICLKDRSLHTPESLASWVLKYHYGSHPKLAIHGAYLDEREAGKKKETKSQNERSRGNTS